VLEWALENSQEINDCKSLHSVDVSGEMEMLGCDLTSFFVYFSVYF
jgi:hypothetical protein